jgi:hypothetical protein
MIAAIKKGMDKTANELMKELSSLEREKRANQGSIAGYWENLNEKKEVDLKESIIRLETEVYKQ